MIAQLVRDKGIRTVVNLRGENSQDAWYRAEREACEKAGIRMVDIRMSASSLPSRENLLLLFDTLTDSKNDPMLIHCKSGADRTGMAAGVWRMAVEAAPREQALKELAIRFGHFKRFKPNMSRLIEMFEPRREWIENEYAPGDATKPPRDDDD